MQEYNEHICFQEKVIGELIEANRNFKDFVEEVKNNHLRSIYNKLENINDKLSYRKPSWIILWIITSSFSLNCVLITLLVKR